MKLAIKKIEKHEEGRFKYTIWFELGGEMIRTKLTLDHIKNLRNKDRIPPKLALGQVLNVCKRKGYTGQDLFYIYGYE